MKQTYIPTNPALLAFGVENVSRELNRFCLSYPNLPLVSIGSGFGRLERVTSEELPEREFILIDPAPDSFVPLLTMGTKEEANERKRQFGLPPDYPLLDDLFVKRPRLFVGNATLLLLSWCNYGNDPYDLGAVLKLRPRAIFLITHREESANSKQFHDYFRDGNGSKRYYCQRRIIVDCLEGKSDEAKYCRTHHSPYLIEWLVDSHVVFTQEKPTSGRISCKSDAHKDAPEIEILKSFVSFMSILHDSDK